MEEDKENEEEEEPLKDEKTIVEDTKDLIGKHDTEEVVISQTLK